MVKGKIKGFTLVELLVTITILAMLATIGMSQFGTAQRKSRDVRRKGDLDGVYKALQAYYADYGRFPASTLGRISIGGAGIDWNGSEFKQDSNLYMKVMPKPVTASTPYCYKADALGTKFGLFVNLESVTDKECDRDNNGVGDTLTAANACGSRRDYCYQRLSPNLTIGNPI
ncbi:MAG: type II secretion system protein [Candidatus Shapirobacteria bacterium]